MAASRHSVQDKQHFALKNATNANSWLIDHNGGDEDDLKRRESIANQEWRHAVNESFMALQATTADRLGLAFDPDTVREILAHHQREFERRRAADGHRYIEQVVGQMDRLRQRFQQHPDDDHGKQQRSITNPPDKPTPVMGQHGDYTDHDHDHVQADGEDIVGHHGPSKSNKSKTSAMSSWLLMPAVARCHHVWQLWFWKSDHHYFKWDYGLQKLAKPISDVKRLWQVLKCLIDVADVVVPSDYSLFRDCISPKWEDPANRNGGCWMVEFERTAGGTDPKVIQAVWEHLLGFTLQQHCSGALQHVNGLKISVRFKVYALSIWTDSFVDLGAIFGIGLELQRLIGQVLLQQGDHQEPRPSLFYRAHRVSQQKAAIKEQQTKQHGACSGTTANNPGQHVLSSSQKLF